VFLRMLQHPYWPRCQTIQSRFFRHTDPSWSIRFSNIRNIFFRTINCQISNIYFEMPLRNSIFVKLPRSWSLTKTAFNGDNFLKCFVEFIHFLVFRC
jgi:hypothetical protein